MCFHDFTQSLSFTAIYDVMSVGRHTHVEAGLLPDTGRADLQHSIREILESSDFYTENTTNNTCTTQYEL